MTLRDALFRVSFSVKFHVLFRQLRVLLSLVNLQGKQVVCLMMNPLISTRNSVSGLFVRTLSNKSIESIAMGKKFSFYMIKTILQFTLVHFLMCTAASPAAGKKFLMIVRFGAFQRKAL